jgi:D-alanine-D-alanine ligase
MGPDLLKKIEDKTATVGVLMGGMSTERPISLKSGKAVAAGLRSRGHKVAEIDVGPDLPAKLREAGVDVAWIVLHGSFGEDGCVQGLLEIMRIPYTGSGVKASAIAMCKIATKDMLRDTSVQLPGDHTWRRGEPIPPGVSYPVVAKTPLGGSTIGIQICADAKELEAALVELVELDETVLLEDMILGDEITCALIDGEAMPITLIRPVDGFFDFDAKYTKGRTEYLTPAPIPDDVTANAQAQSREAYQRLGLRGIARADFIIDADGIPWFLEINTIPGMTSTSLSPMAAAALGISFDELVEQLLLGAGLEIEDLSGPRGGAQTGG